MWPLCALAIPMIARTSVVLPAPLRPISPTNWPAPTLRSTPRRMLAPWIATWSPSTPSIEHLLDAARRVVFADHRRAHRGVGEHRLRCTVGDDAALVEREHAI